MNNSKVVSKAKITLGAILLTFVMLLTLIATPLIAHAATTQKNHASYNTKTGEVTYYDFIAEEPAPDEEGGSNSGYNPFE